MDSSKTCCCEVRAITNRASGRSQYRQITNAAAKAKSSGRERTGDPVVMPKPQGNFLTAIDVGSAKTCVLVAEITENGLSYPAHTVGRSRGARKRITLCL